MALPDGAKVKYFFSIYNILFSGLRINKLKIVQFNEIYQNVDNLFPYECYFLSFPNIKRFFCYKFFFLREGGDFIFEVDDILLFFLKMKLSFFIDF